MSKLTQTKLPYFRQKRLFGTNPKVIMSKTDKFGTIEYANDVFVDVSGYEDYELVGQPHNIIRDTQICQK